MKKYVCTICGYVYDEAAGIPSAGIAPGTTWDALPADWVCPLCRAAKSDFKEEAANTAEGEAISEKEERNAEIDGNVDGNMEGNVEGMKELSFAELSALCSNLAKGCEKQYLTREMDLFLKLADYFKSKANTPASPGLDALLPVITQDLESAYPSANQAADMDADRGAKRALVWSEKVTRMLSSLLNRYEKEGNALLEHTNVFVCEICGFIYVGEEPPAICPVCKVPSFKITKVQRG